MRPGRQLSLIPARDFAICRAVIDGAAQDAGCLPQVAFEFGLSEFSPFGFGEASAEPAVGSRMEVRVPSTVTLWVPSS